MNPDKEKRLEELTLRNPFWICFLVFLLLAGDYGIRAWNLWKQKIQLDQALLMQSQNLGALAQARQLEARLEGFSVDLLQIAQTNAAAKQIVQDFNIQWNPGPAASRPTLPPPSAPIPAAPGPVKTPSGTNK